MSESKRLEMLMRDYELSTQSLRSFDAMTITTLGFGLTVISAIGALLTQACRPDRPLLAWLQLGSSDLKTCIKVSPYILAAVPTIPVMVLSILLIQGTIATARGRYIRTLEVEIRKVVGMGDSIVIPFGFAHLTQQISGGHRSTSRRHALLLRLQWIPAALIATGVGLAAVDLVALPGLQMITVITYGAMALTLLSGVILGYQNSGSLWNRLVNALPSELAHTRAGFKSDSRSLNLRYVLLPRPTELIAKSPLHAMAFFFASRINGHEIPVKRILIFTLILELVLYQARYSVNDLRDMKMDSDHPSARVRGRLENSPGGVRTGLTALSIRLFLVPFLFIALSPRSLKVVFAISIVVVVLSTILYEFAKARARTAPVPFEDKTLYFYAVYLAVGVGYGLRIGAGTHLGGVGWVAVVIGTLFGFLLGILFVVMAWTLEGYSFPTESQVIKTKPHLAYLTRQVKGLEWEDTPAAVRRGRHILQNRPGVRSVVFLAFATSTLVAAVLGVALQSELPRAGYEPFLYAVMAFFVIGVCTVVVLLNVGPVAKIGTTVFFAITFTASIMRIEWGVALFPMSVVFAFYFNYRSLSYSEVNFDFPRIFLHIRKWVGDTWRSVFALLFHEDSYKHHFGKTIDNDRNSRSKIFEDRLKSLTDLEGEQT